MGIENLLAQGVEIRPAGMERNALMQYQQFKDGQQRNALMQMQMQDMHAQRQLALEQARQVAADRARAEQFRQSIPSPQMQASQQALMGGGGPTVGNAAQMRPVDPRLQMLHGAMQAGMGSPLDYMKEAYPKDEFETVAPGASRVNKRTNQVAFTAPKEAKLPDGMQMGANGPEWVPGYLEGRGQIARSGASSIVNYGSPVPVELPGGGVGYVQPNNRGGAVAPMTMPDGNPLRKPADQKDKDLTEGQAKATTYLGQMRSATQALEALKMDQSALSTQAETALAGGVVNVAIGAKAQQVRQSQDQWSEAFLRFKTGAASTKDEVAANRKTFFPTIGDKTDAVAQKKAMRAQAERDMEIAAGRGAKQLAPTNSTATAQPGMPEMSAIDAEIARRKAGGK